MNLERRYFNTTLCQGGGKRFEIIATTTEVLRR